MNDLVEDIRRYLADEPIMARPPTRTEQIRRFVRKNKAASVATCVVALALIAATTISVVFAVEAGRQRGPESSGISTRYCHRSIRCGWYGHWCGE